MCSPSHFKSKQEEKARKLLENEQFAKLVAQKDAEDDCEQQTKDYVEEAIGPLLQKRKQLKEKLADNDTEYKGGRGRSLEMTQNMNK